MKYKKILEKIIKTKKYNMLENKLLVEINKKFKNITQSELEKILEINIKSIFIIGLSKKMNNTEEEIKEKIYFKESKKYLIGNYTYILLKYKKYIQEIINFEK